MIPVLPLMEMLVEKAPRAPHAPSVAEETWDLYKDHIRNLWIEQGKTLKEVRDALSLEYSFKPS